jgi:hypothetical protein
MDSAAHTSDSISAMSTNPTSNRKRPRENETESQRQKREKAAERQRRKRERDRANAGIGTMMGFQTPDGHHHPQQQQAHQQQQQQAQGPPPSSSFTDTELSQEELARRDRVRAAARERQRKHRNLVKARKMRELGLDMGNEILPGMDEVHYRVNAETGQYQQVLPHELQHAHAMGHHEPPFPQGAPLGGQTFASTLLLSFSCAPLLKQHLLRTLTMTNEELASFEPIIAEAWDHWDHQVRFFLIRHSDFYTDRLCTASDALRRTSSKSSRRP